MDKSAVSRRVRVAIDRGYLRNDEDKRGRPSKLALADPLPDDLEILPSADEVRECCTVASESGGIKTPPDVDADDDGRTIADLTDDELLAAAGPGATLERSDQRSEPNPEKATP
jgi:hypothetical protein